MNIIKNGLTIIGALSVVAILYGLYIMEPAYHRFNSFDDNAFSTYQSLFKKILKTGNVAEATVWKVQVEDGLKTAQVEKVIKSVAKEQEIKNIAELILFQQVEASTKKPFRFIKSYMFCNSLSAAKMVRYSDAFSAYLPCRITLLEDKLGKLWLYSLNMDLLIYGGTALPAELKKDMLKIKEIILNVMKRAASGKS